MHSRPKRASLLTSKVSHLSVYFTSLFLLAFLHFVLLAPAYAAEVAGKKVLYIASYHEGHHWTDGTTKGVLEVLGDSGVELKIHYMDTKRNRTEPFKKEAGIKAKNLIEEYKPDAVIVSDDNAVKYLLGPYYRNSQLPFVFSGVNWDASVYGLPYDNATGIVEVELIKPLLDQLRQHAKGNRTGYLAMNSLTSRKNVKWHEKFAGIRYQKIYYVDTYEDWKNKYSALQKEVDMMVLGNPQGIAGWDKTDVVNFVRQHTGIPTGATGPGRENYSLLGYLRKPEEHGRWAAETIIKILKGTEPSTIQITRSKEGNLVINQGLSDKLGITFPPALFKRAKIIWPYEGRKVLYIASYHEGFAWSDGILRGINQVMAKSGARMKTFHMDTKRNRTKEHIQNAVDEARHIIGDFQPDVVITSDDNAAKYLIAPYFKSSELPFVFCGVNWDSSIYGLPTKNVTGMEEVELIESLIEQLRKYAKGDRVGMLSTKTLSGRKNVEYHQRLFGIQYEKVYHVDSFEDWKQAYLDLQGEVDLMVTETHTAIKDWDHDEFVRFARENIKIPTGATSADRADYSLLSYARIPEEQGIWAANTALRILDGKPPAEIPVSRNKQSKLYLNVKLAERLGLTIDRAIYRRAVIVQ